MRTHQSHLLLSLAALISCALQPSCAIDATGEVPDEALEGAAAAPEARPERDQLVALTPIGEDEAPMLDSLAGEMQVVEARPLLEALGAGEAKPAEILARAGAIVADLEQLGSDDIAAYQPLIDAAGAAGVPLVLENIREPSRMAAMIGFGLAADGAVVEPSSAGQSFTVTLLGEDGELTVTEDDAKTRPAAQSAEAPEALAVRVAARLRDLAAGSEVRPLSFTPQSFPIGTYRDFVIYGSPGVWDPNGHDQNATIDMGVQVQLVASSQPNAKFMVISGIGAGARPGSLTWNESRDRGYFQEAVAVSIQPSGASLMLYAHQPGSTNASGTFSKSNGCSFGGGLGTDGASTSFSCNVQTAASVSLPDFGVADHSSGTLAKWSFEMMSVGGAPYNSWDDIIEYEWDCTIRNLPTLAKSTMDPDYEAVYRAEQSFTGTVDLSMQFSQRLRDTWVDYHVFYCDEHTKAFTATLPRAGSADFSKVSLTDVWVPLIVKSSGLAVDVDAASHSQLASIIQWTPHGGDNQLFQFVGTPDGDGYSFIKARHSGLCLDVEGASTAPGARVLQHSCHGGANQRFKRVDAGNGHYYLKPKHSDLCLGPLESTMVGSWIVQSSCTGSDAQLIRFTP